MPWDLSPGVRMVHTRVPEDCLMETPEKTLTTGRTRDNTGKPIEGTGFDYTPGGRVAEALAARISPIYSHPTHGEWGTKLVDPSENGGEYLRGIGVFREGQPWLAAHYHPDYEEHFEILEGTFAFRLDKTVYNFGPGEKAAVPKGVLHTFRYTGKGFGSFLIEARPGGRFAEFIPIYYGLAHDGKFSKSGAPQLLPAMLMTRELEGDTVFPSPPPRITRPLARVLGPLASRRGYRELFDLYRTDEFWEKRVEQP